MNTKEKREWLERFEKAYYEMLDHSERKNSLTVLSASRLSLSPKAKQNGSLTTKLIEKYIEFDKELEELSEKVGRIQKEISEVINQIKDIREQRVLRLRHLNLLTWIEIAEEMQLSRTSIYNIYCKALRHLELNKSEQN